MDREGAQFSLRHEAPQFHATGRVYFLAVYPATTKQYARFLTATRPTAAQRGLYLTLFKRLILPTSEKETLSRTARI
jgi:hypothetical protein